MHRKWQGAWSDRFLFLWTLEKKTPSERKKRLCWIHQVKKYLIEKLLWNEGAGEDQTHAYETLEGWSDCTLWESRPQPHIHCPIWNDYCLVWKWVRNKSISQSWTTSIYCLLRRSHNCQPLAWRAFLRETYSSKELKQLVLSVCSPAPDFCWALFRTRKLTFYVNVNLQIFVCDWFIVNPSKSRKLVFT